MNRTGRRRLPKRRAARLRPSPRQRPWGAWLALPQRPVANGWRPRPQAGLRLPLAGQSFLGLRKALVVRVEQLLVTILAELAHGRHFRPLLDVLLDVLH